MNRNLAIGFSAVLLVVGAIGALAAGLDWDPRDVEAADEYRVRERARAERYRARIAGRSSPTAELLANERDSARETRRQERDQRRQDRRAEGGAWDRLMAAIGVHIDTEQIAEWREQTREWSAWWNDEARPGFERWAAAQEARASADDSGLELPASVERALEESIPAEELDEVREGARRASGWWNEERERMRRRPHRH